MFGTDAFACGTNDNSIKIFKLNPCGSPTLRANTTPQKQRKRHPGGPSITVETEENVAENEEMLFETDRNQQIL